jgi:hypothetical protein
VGGGRLKVANKGAVTYPWVVGDTDTLGLYVQEWEITFVGGKTSTFPSNGYNQIAILRDLGDAP